MNHFLANSSFPVRSLIRRRGPLGRGLRAVGIAAGLALVVSVASSQPADDPFADELNPFGGRPRPTAPSRPEPRAVPQQPPVVPQQPPQSADPAAADPAAADRARAATPDLPLPFPEAAEPRERQRPSRPAPRGFQPGDVPEAWQPTAAEKILIEAEKLERKGDLQAARTKILEAISTDPKLPLSYLALGVVLRRLGQFDDSVDALSKGIALNPEEAEFYLRRGISWFHLGMHGVALEDFEEASGIAYDDPRPELWRGLTLVELGRPLEAINAYSAAIRRDREFVAAYLNRGLAYLESGDFRKAEYDFDQVVRHAANDPRGWFNRGVALASQGRFGEAAASYEQALRRDPRMDGARRNLAAVRGRVGSR